jgi:penicillin-binding protein A
VLDAKALQANVHNPQPTPVNVFTQQRGLIITSDYQVIAESELQGGHWLRSYPYPFLFADVTGYWDVTQSAAPYGLEAEYSNYLGLHLSPVRTLADILTQHEETNDIVTTISFKLQQAAQKALAGRQGAVVAIDPQTGAVLAMYGNPTYNPNVLSGLNKNEATAYFNSLEPGSGSSPLVNAATDELHPPGSTFKIIDTAAIFDHDPAIAKQHFTPQSSITIPGTGTPGQTLHNYGFEECPSSTGGLAQILAESCDTYYASIGLSLGAPTLVQEAEAFGFNEAPPLDLPADVAAPQIPAPSEISYPGTLAISAIGQYDDAASALEMALVSAGVANSGVIMTPHLLDHVLNQQGQEVTSYTPVPWRTATSPATASQLRTLLVGPTSYGTLAGVLSPAELGGIVVGGKTGTAEIVTAANAADCGGFDWVTAFGPDGPGQTPTIAVAAWVSGSGYAAECGGTGAEIAGPVVQSVLRAAFGLG